ncbi:M949_RS01915 family surface polysaccharide biosynthesis protein [Aquimarina sp. 2304DJ70-9]|uniref:M949_RS01915 family surface polysaccharide biosynthesis protein n=1 Tax=Aquimarina penaris TaxID=3231044 RepID=UPI0034628835
MTRFLLLILLLAICACKEQAQESKQVTKQEAIVTAPIEKYDAIPMDSKIASKLSKKEIASIFTRRKQNLLGISNALYQAYSYKDESGEYYLLLTDHRKAIHEEKDTLYDNIYALNITNKNNQLKKRSTVTGEIDDDWETSIGFWNQYSEISDLDGDGLVDLILVYGTTGQNMYKDGRVKILVYHNKKRVSIKHQNSDIDGGRHTKINKKLYALPLKIQDAVKEKMKLMSKNGHAIFSKGWEKEMANKATRLAEK